MAMRTEQHGNLFAKLNNVNLSDGAVRNMKMRPGGARETAVQRARFVARPRRGVRTAKLTKSLAAGETLSRGFGA